VNLMSKTLDIPWEKYSIIANLSKQLEAISPLFGRTVLQKMIYILQEVFEIPCGYEYSFYNYGPYSSELASDLEYVEFLGGVNVTWLENIGGYHITPGAKCDRIISKASPFLDANNQKISQCIEEFGSSNAGKLELIATIIYVDRYSKKNRLRLGSKDLSKKVKELKPKFSESDIEETAKTLSRKKYIH